MERSTHAPVQMCVQRAKCRGVISVSRKQDVREYVDPHVSVLHPFGLLFREDLCCSVLHVTALELEEVRP